MPGRQRLGGPPLGWAACIGAPSRPQSGSRRYFPRRPSRLPCIPHCRISTAKTPSLYVVATPLGNMNDMGLRALAVLKGGRRHRRRGHPAQPAPPRRLRHHHPSGRSTSTTSRPPPVWSSGCSEGKHVALITDAGTPAVSDPGAGPWRGGAGGRPSGGAGARRLRPSRRFRPRAWRMGSSIFMDSLPHQVGGPARPRWKPCAACPGRWCSTKHPTASPRPSPTSQQPSSRPARSSLPGNHQALRADRADAARRCARLAGGRSESLPRRVRAAGLRRAADGTAVARSRARAGPADGRAALKTAARLAAEITGAPRTTSTPTVCASKSSADDGE